MDATLIHVKPDGSKRDVPMKRARLVFGREKTCDVRIPVSSVSREHCELRVEGGKIFVRDMGSSNGTYVNRERVQEVELSPGDLIAVGPAVFVVKVNGTPSEIDAKRLFSQGAGPRPVAATGAVKSRPSTPGEAAPDKPAPADSGDSSVDFDFDFLDDDDDKKQPRL